MADINLTLDVVEAHRKLLWRSFRDHVTLLNVQICSLCEELASLPQVTNPDEFDPSDALRYENLQQSYTNKRQLRAMYTKLLEQLSLDE